VLGPKLEDGDRFYIHVAYHMYMWVGSDVECVRATAEAERIGLFVEPDMPSWQLPDPADRFGWLREGEPVRHILSSFDPRTADYHKQDIPDDTSSPRTSSRPPSTSTSTPWRRSRTSRGLPT